jgi:Cu/Zn superoxide dismutase
MFKNLMLGATAALALALAMPAAHAATEKFKATLDGASETPPNESKGTGTAELTYDTASKKLTYTITYSGLGGDVVAAHFHGPAGPGKAAPPELAITKGPSPIKGDATLTDKQAADLEGGMWYVNIHTTSVPGGEIRGQVTK